MHCRLWNHPVALLVLLGAMAQLAPSTARAGACSVTNTGSNTVGMQPSGDLIVGNAGVGVYGLDGASCSETYFAVRVGFGFLGDGSLTIENGASLAAVTLSTVTNGNPGQVTGLTSVLSGGQVTVTNDCKVSDANDSVIETGTGTLVVSGDGSSLSCADELRVGFDGEGILEVSDMATVTASRLVVGFDGTAGGTVSVLSGGLLEVTGGGSAHTVGVRTSALLDIDGGTLLLSDANGFLTTCTVGATCSVAINVANGGVLEAAGISGQNDTTVSLDGGSIVLPADSGSGEGSLSSSGILQGNGTIIGDSVVNRGDLLPGGEMTTGELAVKADGMTGAPGDFFNVSGAAVVIEIAGDASFDRLLVDGDVTFGGNLQVRFIGGYVPQLGTSFDVLSAGGALDFSPFSVQFFGLPTEIEMQSSVEAVGGDVVVSVPEPAPAAASAAALCTLATLARRHRSPGASCASTV